MAYEDRGAAGKKLAEALLDYADEPDTIVLGLPRGGVPVAYEVAEALDAPLDIFTVRKLGIPGHEELAMGAIATGGVRVMNPDIIQSSNISDSEIEAVAEEERQELERREQAYRGKRVRANLKNRTVLLIDDGLATGATMRAAVTALRKHDPKRIVVAVPTAPPETAAKFQNMDIVDEVVCLETPSPFFGVGGSYRDFSQTTDEEVRMLLDKANADNKES